MKAGGIHLVRLNLSPGSLTESGKFLPEKSPPKKCGVGFYFLSTATQEAHQWKQFNAVIPTAWLQYMQAGVLQSGTVLEVWLTWIRSARTSRGTLLFSSQTWLPRWNTRAIQTHFDCYSSDLREDKNFTCFQSDLRFIFCFFFRLKKCVFMSHCPSAEMNQAVVCAFHGCLSLDVIMFQLWAPEMLNRTENR